MSRLSSDQLNSLLKLLSLLILVDGRVYPEEVTVMGSQLSKLCNQVDKNVMFTPEMGQDWFKSNQKRLGLVLGSKDREQAIAISIMSLRGLNKELLQKTVYAMVRIGWADGEYHPEEEKLVQEAIRIWDLRGVRRTATQR